MDPSCDIILCFQVILAGHVPPGVYGRGDKYWLHSFFNERVHQLLQLNADIVTAAIFGHEHTDAFRIVHDTEGLCFPNLLPSYVCISKLELKLFNFSFKLLFSIITSQLKIPASDWSRSDHVVCDIF